MRSAAERLRLLYQTGQETDPCLPPQPEIFEGLEPLPPKLRKQEPRIWPGEPDEH